MATTTNSNLTFVKFTNLEKRYFGHFSEIKIFLFVVSNILAISSRVSAQQNSTGISVSAGFGEYIPAQFSGYPQNGFFIASSYKSSGVIEKNRALITVTLAPEVPWTTEPFTLPDGWIMDPSSTNTSLTFTNISAWSSIDPYFEIPVRAIAARSDKVLNAGTQITYINNGLSEFKNLVRSSVMVNAAELKDEYQITSMTSKPQITDINSPENLFYVYPNPVKDLLKITESINGNIQILNSAGKEVYNSTHISSEGIDVSHLSTGIYLLRIANKEGSLTVRKFVKQ